MTIFTKIKTFLVVLLLSGAGQLHAALIVDFESVTTDQFDPLITVDGFDFNFTAGGAWVIGPAPSAFGNDNGTSTLLVNSLNPPVEMSKVGGGGFLFTGLDAAVGLVGGLSSLDILGTLLGGGTVKHTLSLNDFYATYTLPSSFNNLMSMVRFTATSSRGFSIDNLTGSVTTTVSAPGTIAMFGLGLAGLVWFRRKKA